MLRQMAIDAVTGSINAHLREVRPAFENVFGIKPDGVLYNDYRGEFLVWSGDIWLQACKPKGGEWYFRYKYNVVNNLVELGYWILRDSKPKRSFWDRLFRRQ